MECGQAEKQITVVGLRVTAALHAAYDVKDISQLFGGTYRRKLSSKTQILSNKKVGCTNTSAFTFRCIFFLSNRVRKSKEEIRVPCLVCGAFRLLRL